MVQLSHPYMTTRKTIALTRWTFVGKVMSLLFNMLSRFVMAFLPRSKCLLISWLQSPFAVILEPQKIKSPTISIVSPRICHDLFSECWVLSQLFHFFEIGHVPQNRSFIKPVCAQSSGDFFQKTSILPVLSDTREKQFITRTCLPILLFTFQ